MIAAVKKTSLKEKSEAKMLLIEEESERLRSTDYWTELIAVEAQAWKCLISYQVGPFLQSACKS